MHTWSRYSAGSNASPAVYDIDTSEADCAELLGPSPPPLPTSRQEFVELLASGRLPVTPRVFKELTEKWPSLHQHLVATSPESLLAQKVNELLMFPSDSAGMRLVSTLHPACT